MQDDLIDYEEEESFINKEQTATTQQKGSYVGYAFLLTDEAHLTRSVSMRLVSVISSWSPSFCVLSSIAVLNIRLKVRFRSILSARSDPVLSFPGFCFPNDPPQYLDFQHSMTCPNDIPSV